MAMSRPDIDAVQLWCRDRVPPERWAFERVEAFITGRHIDIVSVLAAEDGTESRTAVARLRFMGTTRLWTLHWRDGEGSFHRYRNFPAVYEVVEILGFLAGDPDPLFWP